MKNSTLHHRIRQAVHLPFVRSVRVSSADPNVILIQKARRPGIHYQCLRRFLKSNDVLVLYKL